MLMHFSNQRMVKRQSLGYSKQVKRLLSAYNPLFSFASHCALFDYVNVYTPLTQFYGFCKVIVEKKACQDICRVDLFRTCTEEPNSTTLGDVTCCSLVNDTKFSSWFLHKIFLIFVLLGIFFYLHIVKSTPVNQSCKGLSFLSFILTFTSYFTLSCLFIL